MLNYGYLGFILGHEVSHSFDNAGRTYDADGTHVNWWSEDSTQKFSNLTTCLIKQYNSFSFPGMKEKVFLFYIVLFFQIVLPLAKNIKNFQFFLMILNRYHILLVNLLLL